MFESESRKLRQGLATADDTRFVRNFWEIKKHQDYCEEWFPFAKGGAYSTFYSVVNLVVNWHLDGSQIKEGVCQRYPYLKGNADFVVKNQNFYFSKGLTWSDRTTSLFSARAWPRGGIFSVKGSCGFFDDDNTLALGLMNSRVFNGFLSMMVGAAGAAARSYQVGTLGRVPFPSQGDENKKAQVAELASSAWSLKRSTDTANQTSHAFYAPALSPGQFGSRNKKATTP